MVNLEETSKMQVLGWYASLKKEVVFDELASINCTIKHILLVSKPDFIL